MFLLCLKMSSASPLKLYCEFIFAFINHAIMERQQMASSGFLDGALRKTWFRNTTIPHEQIETMFATVSFGLSDLPEYKAYRRLCRF